MSTTQHPDLLNCNRRNFVKYGGIGLAAMSIGGMVLYSNVGASSMGNVKTDELDTDVLIIGGGVAATFAAIKAREQGATVTLVDKGYVGRSGLTPYFHGFAYYDPNDPKRTSPEDWLHGFMWATESMSRKDYIDLFLQDSKTRWDEISSWVPQQSLKTGKGPYLREQIEKSGTMIIEGVMITELLEKNGRVVGAIGIPRDEDRTIVFKAGAVVICTGAGTFKSPGWPASPNTFDGHMMAYRVGAEISGKEWNDFHGTNAVTPGDTWGNNGRSLTRPLVSESSPDAHSLRHLFWSAYDGIVADSSSAGGSGGGPSGGPGGQGGGPTGPDKGHGGPEGGPGGPGQEPGGPPANGGPGGGRTMVLGSALGAAEHRMDGIFPQDNRCWSGIEGLYAAGDAMCTGGVGTAGSSSSGCAVQGARAGIYAAEYAQQNTRVFLAKTDVNNIQKRIFEARIRDKGYSPQWVTRVLQNIMMPYYVLYVKRQDRLEAALTNVNYLKEHFVPRLIAKDPHELRLALETENMILNAEMKLRASMFRKESRHSHFREDFPFRDDKNWLSFVIIHKDREKMAVKKWDIPKEWIPSSLSNMSYEKRYTDRFPGETDFIKSGKVS